MRKKAFIYIFIASAIAVLITGIITIVVMQSTSIEEAKLTAQAMAKMIINEINDEDTDYDQKAKDLGESVSYDEYIPYRITIIAQDGVVLGDSNADVKTMDNHSDRPEVVLAKQTGVGSAMRESVTLKIKMLYVAVRDINSDMIVRVALPLTELRRMNYSLLFGSLISILAGVIIAIISSFIFAKRLTKPINQLAMASYELAGGNMNKRVKLNTKTELDKLSEAFNQMASKLDTSLNKLKHKNAEFDSVLSSMGDGLIAVDMDMNISYMNPIAKDIFLTNTKKIVENQKLTRVIYHDILLNGVKDCLFQNKAQFKEIKLGVDEILEYRVTIYPMHYKESLSGAIILVNDITNILKLERLRSDFVANVSHELRTPLTSIKGYAETLKHEDLKNSKNAKRFLDIIEIEADRLNGLINDLMELSEIENKKEDVNISEYSFNQIVNETVELIIPSANKKNVEISVDVQKDIYIKANKDRIKQLLLNLIDNGIKYNNDNGKLDITASAHENMLKIIIKDTGLGIDAQGIPRLFERFYRVDKSRSKLSGGTGLGLSIVKHITELYNGSVTVKSIVNEGTEFIINMPIVITRE